MIRIGQLLLVKNDSHARPRPKDKYQIVIGMCENSEYVATLFVNSSINQGLSTELQSLQYKISVEDCPCLNHDSFVDCSDIKHKIMSLLTNGLNRKEVFIIGEINPVLLKDIIKTVVISDSALSFYIKKYQLTVY